MVDPSNHSAVFACFSVVTAALAIAAFWVASTAERPRDRFSMLMIGFAASIAAAVTGCYAYFHLS